MPNFRETRECLLHFYSEDSISDEEFYLLYDINKSKNPDFEFWRYQKLNLNLLSDDDVFAEFRFMKHDITRMAEVLNIPNEITCHFSNDLKVDGLLSPYAGAQLTQQQKDFNKSMSKARVSVEWMFGEIVEKFKFVDFKKNLKVGLTSVGKIYRVSAILTNAHACLYKNKVSEFYGIEPPTLEQYFQ